MRCYIFLCVPTLLYAPLNPPMRFHLVLCVTIVEPKPLALNHSKKARETEISLALINTVFAVILLD